MSPSPSSPDRSAGELDRRRKAAIVVQALLAAGDRPPLAALGESAQAHLAREIGRLSVVEKETLHAVAAEFADHLERVGFAAPRGVTGALSALGTHISPEVVARLRAEAGRAEGDPWAAVGQLAPEALARLLEAESTEVAAVVLSKLPVKAAAEALGHLPGERARRVVFAVSHTGATPPEVVRRIGEAAARSYCGGDLPAFAAGPAERVGAILNSSAAATRTEVLEGLDHHDSAFAGRVRRAIFTFPQIPVRVKAADVPRILRGLESRTVAQAIASARLGPPDDRAAADFLLASLPQRLGDSLREEMEALGPVRARDAEAAQSALIAAIREIAALGEIALLEPEGEG